MYKSIVVSVLALGVLLLGGVGQIAAKTCLIGGCHSPSEVLVGSDVIWSGVDRLDEKVYKDSPSLHTESGTIVLDLPVLENKGSKVDVSQKQAVRHGAWHYLARSFKVNISVFQQAVERGAEDSRGHLGSSAVGALYLLFGVIRV